MAGPNLARSALLVLQGLWWYKASMVWQEPLSCRVVSVVRQQVTRSRNVCGTAAPYLVWYSLGGTAGQHITVRGRGTAGAKLVLYRIRVPPEAKLAVQQEPS